MTTVTPSAVLPSLCQVKCLASSLVAAAVTAAQLVAQNSLSHGDAINFDPVDRSLVIRSGGFSSPLLNSLSQHGFTLPSHFLLQLDQGMEIHCLPKATAGCWFCIQELLNCYFHADLSSQTLTSISREPGQKKKAVITAAGSQAFCMYLEVVIIHCMGSSGQAASTVLLLMEVLTFSMGV